MEALRRAVHQEGPKPGHITLTVARRMQPAAREAEGQAADDSSASVRLGSGLDASALNDHSAGSSDQSGSTVIFVSGTGSRNGLCDLRNESYYRATHETWNATQLHESVKSSAGPGRRQHSQNSPTVQLTPGEVVSIDGDYMPQRFDSSGTSDQLDQSWHYGGRAGPVDGRDKAWHEPGAQSPCSDRPSDSDAPTYASQTSLEDPNGGGFSRDQFGRQSMSEKRHASLDAKSTDTYQRNKKLREEREKQKQQETEMIQQLQQQQQQAQQQKQHQSTKENVPPSGRTTRPIYLTLPLRLLRHLLVNQSTIL